MASRISCLAGVDVAHDDEAAAARAHASFVEAAQRSSAGPAHRGDAGQWICVGVAGVERRLESSCRDRDGVGSFLEDLLSDPITLAGDLPGWERRVRHDVREKLEDLCQASARRARGESEMVGIRPRVDRRPETLDRNGHLAAAPRAGAGEQHLGQET